MLEVCILILILAVKFRPAFTGLSCNWLDNFIVEREELRGRLVWVIQLSAVLVLAACFYARLDTHCSYLGGHYARLAENPFAFDPDISVSYRLLTPFISYCLGLRGQLIIVTNLLISGLMIGVVYSYFRKVGGRPGDAFLAVVILTFSLVVLTGIHCGGYCDILTYLLVFLMWQYCSKRLLFYVLFLLGLLNRESVLFLLPWFVFISLRSVPRRSVRILEMIAGFGLVLGVYYMFRLWVASHQEVQYSLGYYLNHLLTDPLYRFRMTYYYHGVGLFSVFKVLWVIPLLAAFSFWKKKNYAEIVGMAILLVCSYAQLLVAGDTSRLLTLGFMVMFVSLEHLLDTDFFRFRHWVFWAVLFNLFIPQVYTAANVVESWQSVSGRLLGMLLE